jgi:AraC-like DNA-binding protein
MLYNSSPYKQVFLYDMLCSCCTKLLKFLLEKDEIPYIKVEMGSVIFDFSIDDKTIDDFLSRNSFKKIEDKNIILVQQIKTAVIELVHYANNSNSIIRNSDYLVEKIGKSYQQLSGIFGEYENQTLEKFIIAHKIEKTKRLLIINELTLSEIAFQMGYSSVQYLSNQFKKITGLTVSEFKKLKKPEIKSLDEI